MKKLLICLVALLATIGAQASTQTIEKGFGLNSTSTVKFGATDKDFIEATATYSLKLNDDKTLSVEVTFGNLDETQIAGLDGACFMWIEGPGETRLTLADGKYTGTTTGTVEPGKFYQTCYFKRACQNTAENYGVEGQLIFPFQFTAPKEGIYFDLKLGEPTMTTNSYSIPYEFVVHPEDTDLTGVTDIDVWLDILDGGNLTKTHYNTLKGTIVQEGLVDNKEYTLYNKATLRLNDTHYAATNDTYNFKVKTLKNADAVKFSIEAEQTGATSSSVTMHYKFVPTDVTKVPEGTTYRVWFDVADFADPEVYATNAEGDITIKGLHPEKTYNLYTKGYYTLPGSSEQHITNYDAQGVFKATTTAGGEISGTVTNIAKNTATLTLNCEPAEGKTVEKIVVSGLGVGKDITFYTTENLTAELTGLVPGTDYTLTFTLTYTDGTTAEATRVFRTLDGVRPSITYSNEYTFTNITGSSADLNVTVTLANPDNYPIEYWRLAAARAPGDQKLDGVEYEKWPYNDDLIWGQYRSTEGADGTYTVTIPLVNLPAATTINNYMKSEIKIAGEENAYQSNGAGNWTVTTLEAKAATVHVTNITHNSATLTLEAMPEGATTVTVTGIAGKDITFTEGGQSAELTGLNANTQYNLSVIAHFTSDDVVSTITFKTAKVVEMELIEVNVSDLSALYKIKVEVSDNATSKENIIMYIREADAAEAALADDPYAAYGTAKGTPALDPREGIENPLYFNYTELKPSTKYVATAVVKKEGYYGVASQEFTTTATAVNTSSYIENGYFQDGALSTADDGSNMKMTHTATARYTFTYDAASKTLYLTFDTRITNNPTLPDLVSKYLLTVQKEPVENYDGYPVANTQGFKDHYSFVINNRCPNVGEYVENKTPMHFTYFTDYRSGGQSHFGGVDYNGETKSENFGEPNDIIWVEYTYENQQTLNKNRYNLHKEQPKTQIEAVVVDAEGHYLPLRKVEYEMVEEHNGLAEVTSVTYAELPAWFVEAKTDLEQKTFTFDVIAFHVLENAAAPAGAPRRAVSQDGTRLEANHTFLYSEVPTGINDINADDANAPVRYFDLNGREISNPQKGMFVIRLQGSKATKLIVK